MKISHAPIYQMTARQRLDWRIAQFEAEVYRNGWERGLHLAAQLIMLVSATGDEALVNRLRKFFDQEKTKAEEQMIEPEDVYLPNAVLVNGVAPRREKRHKK